jgi:hypothetical protein
LYKFPPIKPNLIDYYVRTVFGKKTLFFVFLFANPCLTAFASLHSNACYLYNNKEKRITPALVNHCYIAAKAGDAQSQYIYGKLAFLGKGVKKSELLGTQLWIKAANNGVLEAQRNLGWLHQTGRVVKKDYKQAFNWYVKAALKGDPYATHYLGMIFQNGLGVKANNDLAIKWYKKSAIQGLVDSEYNLAVAYYTDNSNPANVAISYAWMLLASQQNYQPAFVDIKILDGLLTETEKTKGRKLAQRLKSRLAKTKHTQLKFLHEEFGLKAISNTTNPLELVSRLSFQKRFINDSALAPNSRKIYFEIALSVAKVLENKNWQRIVIDTDLKGDSAKSPIKNNVAIYVGENSQSHAFYIEKFPLQSETKTLMSNLNTSSNKNTADNYQMILDNNGEFKFKLSDSDQQILKGISGTDTDSKILRNYLDQYIRDAIIYRK